VFFEDEIIVVPVAGGIASDIGAYLGVFLFGTEQEDASLAFSSFMGCQSG
jgi:hypothetical protein